MVEALRYKLRIFGVPIYGSSNIFWDNKAVYNNNITPESVLRKKQHSIAYHRCSDSVSYKTIRFSNQVFENNIAGFFIKIMTASRGRFSLDKLIY